MSTEGHLDTELPRTMCLAEYLALDDASDLKHEFVRGAVRVLGGWSLRHSLLTANIQAGLGAALSGSRCRAHSSQARIRGAENSHFYPDASVVCGATETTEEDRRTLLNPKVIVEVLSPSTADYDRGTKLAAYTTIPSLTDCILVAQEEPLVIHYHRTDVDRWDMRILRGLGASVQLDELGINLSLAEIYERYKEEPLG